MLDFMNLDFMNLDPVNLDPVNYVSIIEDNLYMLWQTEVQIHNFRKLGLLEQLTVVLLHRSDQPSS